MSRKILALSAGGVVLLASIATVHLFKESGSAAGDSAASDPTARPSQASVEPFIQPPDLATASGSAANPARPGELIEQALRSLPSLPLTAQDAALRKLLADLRAAGPAGLRAVADFLRSGHDVSLRDEYGLSGNRVTTASTLRVALLDALANWEGSAAVLLEFLKSPASGWEIILAVRNLELEFPSTYRAEATAALKAVLARPADAAFGEGGESHLFATVARLGASDLLPQAEALAIATSNVPRYVESLAHFPEETRAAALASVFSRPEVAAEIEAAPQTLNYWSFEDAQTRAFVHGVFRSRLAPEQQVAVLDGLSPHAPILPVEQRLFSSPQTLRETDRAATAAALREAQARKIFLAEVAADETQSAEVQAAVKDARRRITEDLAAGKIAARAEANSLIEVDFAQGSGKAQIKGRRIEQIELQAPAVTQSPLPEDSTESSPR